MEYVPTAHAVHVVEAEPVPYFPAAQFVQVATAVAAEAVEYSPAPQLVQPPAAAEPKPVP